MFQQHPKIEDAVNKLMRKLAQFDLGEKEVEEVTVMLGLQLTAAIERQFNLGPKANWKHVDFDDLLMSTGAALGILWPQLAAYSSFGWRDTRASAGGILGPKLAGYSGASWRDTLASAGGILWPQLR